MKNTIQKMGRVRQLRRLRRNTQGVSIIEFALSLPILLVLILGGLESANYALAHLRVSQIAMTVADNAGRVETTMDEIDVSEVFAGAELVGQAIDFEANGRIVLSSLQPNNLSGADEGQMINWQRCFGDLADVPPSYGVEGDGRTDNSLAAGMGPSGNQITSADGTAVMFVEASYDYQPIIVGLNVIGERQIRYESAFNVRGRTNQSITNTMALAVSGC